MNIHPTLQALISEFKKETKSQQGSTKFSVSRAVSMFAVLYEKARNAVEFRAEHLVRRAAIERMLKRLIILEHAPRAIAEGLIVELMWAKYVDGSLINEDIMDKITDVIEKYLIVKKYIPQNGHSVQGVNWATILGIASTEIDETIIPANKRQAMVGFVYHALRPKIVIPEWTEEQVNMYTYIAVERSFAQSDTALIIEHLLMTINPHWHTWTKDQGEEAIQSMLASLPMILTAVNDGTITRITKFMQKQLPPFLLLRDICFENEHTIDTLIENPEEFEKVAEAMAANKYKQIGQKVRRAVVRSIIYILITKMVFALALEVPFDLFIAKRMDYLPIAINLLFPPLLLFLIAGFINVPGSENTKRLIERLKDIVYHFDEYLKEPTAFMLTKQNKRPILTMIFSVFYIAGFILSFGAINYVLSLMHFNIASKTIFLFFIALVSLFAYRIRQSAKEYEIIDHQGVIEPLVDFFFLPILYAGDLLSKEIAKINIFMFIFDFILEAPIKVIFEVIEEWIRFIRTKKEEIL